MIIDVITYNGEKELFDLRYNILWPWVDQFIVVEFEKTFSGKSKPWYFKELQYKYLGVKYIQVFEELYERYRKLAESSPNTVGADHWKREFMQKESIKDCLIHLDDDDIVFISDCDEIWKPPILGKIEIDDQIYKLRQKMYVYYLNQRTSEDWIGTLLTKYKNIKHTCLNHLRTTPHQIMEYGGWHFSSMGGIEEVRRKLNDSYTVDSYNTEEVQRRLEERFGKADYIGRDFRFWLDENDWPEYLRINKNKYAKMLDHNS